MAGTPAHWRTATSDADRDPLFLDVWLHEFDAISPWTVGRYRTEEDTDGFYERVAKGDADLLRKRAEEGHKKVDYVPVVLPGGSVSQLSVSVFHGQLMLIDCRDLICLKGNGASTILNGTAEGFYGIRCSTQEGWAYALCTVPCGTSEC